MKTCFWVLVLVGLFWRGDTFAGVTVKTRDGKVYENAEVKAVESGVVSLSHSGGEAKLPFSKLSKAVRQKLGIAPTPETAKADFDRRVRAFKKTLFELDVTYAEHLSKLEKEAQGKGLLDEVLAVKKELAEFRKGGQPGEIKYGKLKDLRAVYDRERMKRRNQIVDGLKVALEQYRDDLQEVQKNLTIAGKVEEAVLAKKEAQRVEALLADRKQALDSLGLFSANEIAKASAGQPAKSAGTMAQGGGGVTSASKEEPFENSLGMKFVPVPIHGGPRDGETVLFSIWETRVEDYDSFLKRNREYEKRAPDFRQKRDHPVVNVFWREAEAFCSWLTERERRRGDIGEGEAYRLPTDHEWSCAAGIGGQEEGAAPPVSKKLKIANAYPWGDQFPPPAEAGNFYGIETEDNPYPGGGKPIAGYDDGFDRSAAVGSFATNRFGLFDTAGNVSEWCRDWYDPNKKINKVFRGGAWLSSAPGDLNLSVRAGGPRNFSSPALGFRVVLASVQ